LSTREIEREQNYVAMLYQRVDELRERAAERMAGVLREAAGTRQARVEREVAVTRYAERVAKFDAAEKGLCFGRLDRRDDERFYIGRIGVLDEEGDPLLLDWRPGRTSLLRRHGRRAGRRTAPAPHHHARPAGDRPGRRGAGRRCRR
jgi:DNA helicase IV